MTGKIKKEFKRGYGNTVQNAQDTIKNLGKVEPTQQGLVAGSSEITGDMGIWHTRRQRKARQDSTGRKSTVLDRSQTLG